MFTAGWANLRGEWGVTLRHQSGLRDSGVLGRPALIWWVDLHRTPSQPLLQSAEREWGYNIFYNPSYSPSQDLEQGQRVNTISTSHYIISLSQRTWGERELKWDSVTENETHTYIWHHVLRHVQACLNHQKEYPDRLKPDTDGVIFFLLSFTFVACQIVWYDSCEIMGKSQNFATSMLLCQPVSWLPSTAHLTQSNVSFLLKWWNILHVMWPLTNIRELWTCKCGVKLSNRIILYFNKYFRSEGFGNRCTK